MTTKLTDAQQLMLNAAAQREDRILAMPPNLKGGAAQKVAAKLIAAGLVKEVKAKSGGPAWRRDGEVAATGWLPHTSRAALTGLRKRGYAIEKRLIAEGRRSYIIVAADQAS